MGDEVEVREAVSSKDRPRWLRGLVRCVGEKDGAEVECAGGAVLEMFENEDGEDEVVRRPLLLLNRTQQVSFSTHAEWEVVVVVSDTLPTTAITNYYHRVVSSYFRFFLFMFISETHLYNFYIFYTLPILDKR